MLPFQKQSWDFLNKRESVLILTGKGMNTIEVLTLLLVVFAALTYMDNHKK